MPRSIHPVALGALLLVVSHGLPVVAFGGQATRLERRIIEPIPRSIPVTDDREHRWLSDLYLRLSAGEPCALEEGVLLRRWASGSGLSDVELDVLRSRVLFKFFIQHVELTESEAKILEAYELATSRRSSSILDQKMKLLAEREVAEKTSTPREPAAVAAQRHVRRRGGHSGFRPVSGPFDGDHGHHRSHVGRRPGHAGMSDERLAVDLVLLHSGNDRGLHALDVRGRGHCDDRRRYGRWRLHLRGRLHGAVHGRADDCQHERVRRRLLRDRRKPGRGRDRACGGDDRISSSSGSSEARRRRQETPPCNSRSRRRRSLPRTCAPGRRP